MKKTRLVNLLIFIIVFICLSGTAFGEIGVTDSEIKIGSHMALTGPAAVVGQLIGNGSKMYFKYINDKGGIHKRKIKFILEDDAFMPSRAKEAVKKLINRDKVFAIVAPLQGAGILASVPDIKAAKIPVLFPMSASNALFKPVKKGIFGWVVPYYVSSAIQIDMAMELGKKKIALINQWGPVGKDNIEGATKQLKKYGLELAMVENLKQRKMDYSGLVAKMKSKGIDCVLTATTIQWTAPLMKEIERQGWKVTTIIGHGSSDIPLLNRLAGTAVEGAYVVMNHVPVATNNPTMNAYRAILKKYGGDARPGMYHFIGYAIAKMFCEALEQTGQDLTREKLIQNLESWKDHDTGWIGRLTYSPESHTGAQTMVTVQIRGGKGIILGPRRSPK